MNFSREDVKYWEPLISGSGDVDLIRRFFNRIGKPEKVKKVLEKRVKELAEHDILLQREYSKGYFNPELSQKEVREIARGTLKRDIAKGDVEALSKLCYPIFRMQVPDAQMRKLVNKAIRGGQQGYYPGKDPVSFADGLIEFPLGNEYSQEVAFVFSVFLNRKYDSFVEPDLARNIVTLKIFHHLLLENFGQASRLRKKYAQHYDEAMLREMTSTLLVHPNFIKDYGEGYMREVAKSQWKEVFPEFVIPEKKKDGKKEDSKLSDEEALKSAFEEAKKRSTFLCGVRDLNELLESKAFVKRFGRQKLKQALEQRVDGAMAKGNASEVYSMFYGQRMHLIEGEIITIEGVKNLAEYVQPPDSLTLLEKMIRRLPCTPKVILSKRYSFQNNYLSNWVGEIENAYALAQKMLAEGTESTGKLMHDAIFLKMTVHTTETYMGTGAKDAIAVYTAPQNRPFIVDNEIKALWHKVIPAIEQSFHPGHLLSSDCVSYCFNLVDSPFGGLVEDIPALKPYLKLREFLREKQLEKQKA